MKVVNNNNNNNTHTHTHAHAHTHTHTHTHTEVLPDTQVTDALGFRRTETLKEATA